MPMIRRVPFIQAARADYTGAEAFNLGGFAPDMQDVKDAIDRAAPEAADKITFEDIQLPFPQEGRWEWIRGCDWHSGAQAAC